MRDYIINLQSRLLETQGEIPPAPAGVDLTRQHPEPSNTLNQVQQQQPQQQQQPEPQAQQQSPNPNATATATANNNGGLSERQIGELQMAAQAAAAAQHGAADSEYANKRQKVDVDSTASGQLPISYPVLHPPVFSHYSSYS